MARPRKSQTTGTPLHPQLARLWRTWWRTAKGANARPAPLDRFLSRELKRKANREALTHAMRGAAAWCTTALAVLDPKGPDGVPKELASLRRALRRADPIRLVGITEALRTRDPSHARLHARIATWAEQPEGRLVAAGVPPAWSEALAAWQKTSPEAFDAWLSVQHEPPPLWLRLDDERAIASLREEGFHVSPGAGAVSVEGTTPLPHTEAWQAGWVEVQDLASQAIGRAVRAQPRELIWDMCAGSGGKTMLLARALEGMGQVLATDIHAPALDRLRSRSDRLGLDGLVTSRTWDGTQAPALPRPVRRQGGFDAVLVDAPCSASGTWRRDPDARLRAQKTEGWSDLQLELLTLGAQHVRPGGRLVYGTCSVLTEENEAVVTSLQATLKGWVMKHTMRLGPPRQNSHNMFVAVWEKPQD